MIKAREKQNGEKTMMVAIVKFKGIKGNSFIPKKEKKRKGVGKENQKIAVLLIYLLRTGY